MNQNFIKIFENKSGNVTIQYGAANDDSNPQQIDIEMIEIHYDDLETIAQQLKYLHETIQE